MKEIKKPATDRVKTGLFTLLILLLSCISVFSQNVGINATGAVPNAAAGLDVDFPNKGVLIPRVALTGTTSFAPLTAHVAGMVVYNTATAGDVTPGLYYNDGTKWIPGKMAGTAAGNMLYWNGNAWAPIPAGSAGQYLTLNESGIPTWTYATVAGNYATLTTTNVSAITTTTATTGGNITNDGGMPVLTRGVCYGTSPNPTTSNSVSTASPATGVGTYTNNLTGLLSGTTYYVRAFATNSTVTSYGNEISFTTSASIPSLAATTAATSITGNTAVSGGNVTSNGGAAILERGVCYGTTANPTITGSKVTDPNPGTGTFVSNLSGLNGGTTYYVRAYATNSIGTAYGTQISLTTAVTPPTLLSVAASNISGTSASSGGSMNWNGGGYSNYQNYGVCYSTTPVTTLPVYIETSSPNYARVATNTSNGSVNINTPIAPWVTNLTGLASNTTYYIRSYLNLYRSSTSSWITVYGPELSFTTTGPTAPILSTTTAITGISANTATSGGNITSNGGAPLTAKGVCWSTSPNPTLGINNFTNDGTSTGIYTSAITGLAASTTYHVRSYATNSAGTSYGPDVQFTTWVQAPYTLGQYVGYGWCAYVAPDGSGFIVSPDIPLSGAGWGCSGTSIATGTILGTGKTNTDLILATCATRPIAASIARDYTGGGFNDWYLPSNGEWAILASYGVYNLIGIGSSTNIYYTSSQSSATSAGGYFTNFNQPYFSGAAKAPGASYVYNIRAIRNFAPATLPAVTTSAITNIEAVAATGGGNVTNDGGAPILEAGVCWSTSANPTIVDSKTNDATATGAFVSTISGLSLNMTYHVRAYATNIAGTAYGSDVSFTTLSSATAPIITTESITAQTDVSGTSGGTIISDGGDLITVSGICWNTTGSPTTADDITTDGTTSGTFYSDATGLTAGTTYYIRAYATNGIGTSYGNEITFTPVPVGAPIITTDPIYNLLGTMAEGGGNLVTDGGNPITEWGLCWSESPNPTTSSNKVTDTYFLQNPGAANFYANMTGLTVGTTYHVRAYATNSAATSYGEDITFTATAATLGQVLSTGWMYGVVYSVDGTGAHGLITSIYNAIGGDTDWGCANSTSGATGTAVGDGKTNTATILADIANNGCETSQGWGPGNLAPELIKLFIGPNWHLPSKGELDLLWTNKGLDTNLDLNITNAASLNSFWSSSEVDATHAWSFNGTTWVNTSLKTDILTVWPVMSF